MRILILDKALISANRSEKTNTVDFSRHLATIGHSVTVVMLGEERFFSSEKATNVEIHFIKSLRVKKFFGDFLINFSYLLSAHRYLKALMKENCSDVACIPYMPVTGLLGVWLKKKYALPYILLNFSSDVVCNSQKWFHVFHKLNKQFWSKACSEAWAVTVTSEYQRDIILKNNPNTRCEVVPNGVEIEEYFHIPKHMNVLTNCELDKHAGVQDLIRAFSILDAEGWLLFISGDGPYRLELEKLAENLGIANHIYFIGWPERKSEKYKMILARTSIYVSMSRYNDNSISIAEAIASGCNVVLSDTPSHRYFQRFGAMLVPLNNQLTLECTLQMAMRKTAVFDNTSSDLDWSSIVKQIDALIVNAATSINNRNECPKRYM